MKRKILIIGGEHFDFRSDSARFDFVEWDDLLLGSIKDHDIVIINLLNRRRTEQMDWSVLNINLGVDSLIKALMNDGTVIVLGDPRPTGPIHGVPSPNTNLLDWTGCQYDWDYDRGDTLTISSNPLHTPFRKYVQSIDGWEYSLQSWQLNHHRIDQSSVGADLNSRGCYLTTAIDQLCWNRYGNAIAFIQRFRVEAKRNVDPPKMSFGNLVFLPSSTLTEEQALRLVVQDVCDVVFESPEPSWLIDLMAPGQGPIDVNIGRLTDEIMDASERLAAMKDERLSIRKCLKLLYETGSSLEEAVWEALEAIGATVERPTEPNQEDGWLEIKVGSNVLRGVLEIKSTTNEQFPIKGIRQLATWRQRGIELRETKYKPIFIGSANVNREPSQRPLGFSDQCLKEARLMGVAILRCEDLYGSLLAKHRGVLNRDGFWTGVFAADGLWTPESVNTHSNI